LQNVAIKRPGKKAAGQEGSDESALGKKKCREKEKSKRIRLEKLKNKKLWEQRHTQGGKNRGLN